MLYNRKTCLLICTDAPALQFSQKSVAGKWKCHPMIPVHGSRSSLEFVRPETHRNAKKKKTKNIDFIASKKDAFGVLPQSHHRLVRWPDCFQTHLFLAEINDVLMPVGSILNSCIRPHVPHRQKRGPRSLSTLPVPGDEADAEKNNTLEQIRIRPLTHPEGGTTWCSAPPIRRRNIGNRANGTKHWLLNTSGWRDRPSPERRYGSSHRTPSVHTCTLKNNKKNQQRTWTIEHSVIASWWK